MRADDDEDDGDGERSESACPYCSSTGACPHLLLLIDKTSRSAEGGLLLDAFDERWNEICDQHEDDPKFDEGSEFDELLAQVDSVADAYDQYDFEGGPGQSSTYEVYYVASVAKGKKALARFSAGAGPS